MKSNKKTMQVVLIAFVSLMAVIGITFITNDNYVKKESNIKLSANNIEIKKYSFIELVNLSETVIDPIVYDNLTLEELSDKLNRSLNSTISGKGDLIASYSLEKGVDPYLATAIMLHETGCKWECSTLVKQCNNVGGQKGSGCGSYSAFPTLDDGIRRFIDNLAKNYYAYGLNTPELMNSKYAASTSWAVKVNSYIESIKAQ